MGIAPFLFPKVKTSLKGKDERYVMKYIITLIGTLFAFVITAEEMETIASLTKKISQAEIEKRKMDRENPCVVYAEEDNPSMNVKKTMDRRNGKYSKGVTVINRTFFCPLHKSNEKCETPSWGAPPRWCRKGQFAFSQWNTMRQKLENTNEYDEKIEAQKTKIAELKEKLEVLKEAEKQKKEKEKRKKQSDKAK